MLLYPCYKVYAYMNIKIIKISSILLLSFNIGIVAFADNRLQDKFERDFINENVSLSKFNNIDNFYLMKEDYEDYIKGKDTIYGRLKDKADSLNISKCKEYYINMIANIDLSLKTNIKLRPIEIEDTDYANFDDELKNDIAMYNYMMVYKPIVEKQISSKNITRHKKTAKEKLKEIDKTLNLGIFKESNAEIQAAINAPIIERNKEIQELNKYLEIINERAFNTSLLFLDGAIIDGQGHEYSGEELISRIEATDKQVKSLYAHFKNNPTDMKNNYELIVVMGTAKGEYTSNLKATQKDFLQKAYDVYCESYKNQRDRENIQKTYHGTDLTSYGLKYYPLKPDMYIEKLSTKNPTMYKVHLLMTEKNNDYDNKASEIEKYSYNYEKEKYKNWLIRNNKKQIKGSIEQFIYNSYIQPQIGALYSHQPQKNLYLKVFQTVPNGIILTGSEYVTYNSNYIFVETSKPFVDGQIISEPLTVEFRGYYDYYTVLGARKRIYKFYRLGQNELDNNFKIPGQKFYFFEPLKENF